MSGFSSISMGDKIAGKIFLLIPLQALIILYEFGGKTIFSAANSNRQGPEFRSIRSEFGPAGGDIPLFCTIFVCRSNSWGAHCLSNMTF
ncbi:hypothetical protein FOCC_FOCC017192 [Frankliniella occidentalis]|nr:hypothetical protein FOCC_FOCC017192 [Frankliniella occidentalis]